MTQAKFTLLKLLNSHLATLDLSACTVYAGGELPVAEENTLGDLTPGQAYLEGVLLPATPIVMELGPTPLIKFSGIYQVTVSFPVGEGWGEAHDVAGVVCSHFKRGTALTADNGQVLKVQLAWEGVSQRDDAWYRVPVSVMCYMNAREGS